MQDAVSKKRLYEEQLVKRIVMFAVLKFANKSIPSEADAVEEFVNDNFDCIVKDVLES